MSETSVTDTNKIGGGSIKPTTLLIAAMGGEGGGVLSNWVLRAAESEGLLVQTTSIPGVAQRTGATTYYMEFLPPLEAGQKKPVMSLYPAVTGIDIMAATEIVEAGRAMERGFVTPERTTLVASTHRFFAMSEKTAMGDERFNTDLIAQAADELSKHAVLFDMDKMAKDKSSVINSVMLGAIAATGVLPVSKEAFAEAIRSEGKAVENSLAAFEAGYLQASGGAEIGTEVVETARHQTQVTAAIALQNRARTEFPEAVHDILDEGVKRLVDYQSPKYAARYLDRMNKILIAETQAGADDALELTRETGRYLALWMSYEDVIRVAQLKTKPDRFTNIRKEAGALADQPVKVYDYLKPGIYELASTLPSFIGGPLIAMADRGGWRHKSHIGLHINSTSITGFLTMRFLANLRFLRPVSYRNREEQQRIDIWLQHIETATGTSLELAQEIALCARLIKGYGETHERGTKNFDAILQNLVAPALRGEMDPSAAAKAIARSRDAALADEAGSNLNTALAELSPPSEITRSAAE